MLPASHFSSTLVMMDSAALRARSFAAFRGPSPQAGRRAPVAGPAHVRSVTASGTRQSKCVAGIGV